MQTTKRGTVLNGRDLTEGDVIGFMGHAHPITWLEDYQPEPRWPGSDGNHSGPVSHRKVTSMTNQETTSNGR